MTDNVKLITPPPPMSAADFEAASIELRELERHVGRPLTIAEAVEYCERHGLPEQAERYALLELAWEWRARWGYDITAAWDDDGNEITVWRSLAGIHPNQPPKKGAWLPKKE